MWLLDPKELKLHALTTKVSLPHVNICVSFSIKVYLRIRISKTGSVNMHMCELVDILYRLLQLLEPVINVGKNTYGETFAWPCFSVVRNLALTALGIPLHYSLMATRGHQIPYINLKAITEERRGLKSKANTGQLEIDISWTEKGWNEIKIGWSVIPDSNTHRHNYWFGLFVGASWATCLSVSLLKVVQALRVGLLADVGLEDNKIFSPSLLC